MKWPQMALVLRERFTKALTGHSCQQMVTLPVELSENSAPPIANTLNFSCHTTPGDCIFSPRND